MLSSVLNSERAVAVGHYFRPEQIVSELAADLDVLVAAHPSLPFGSIVRVTNLENKRAVIVQIVDRGPAESVRAGGVIIDLSRATAERLDFIRAGRAKVRLEVLKRGSGR